MANNQSLDVRSERALTLGSGCKLAFIKRNEEIIPVLVLIGINKQGTEGTRVSAKAARGRIGIITSKYNKDMNLNEVDFKESPIQIKGLENGEQSNNDWLKLIYGQDKIVYPRIFINSLKMRTDSDSLVVSYEDYSSEQVNNRIMNYVPLTPYQDYSILTRSIDEQYVITINPDIVIKKGALGSYTGAIETRQAMMKYSISNADTSIYLDALEIAKQNSVPKVSYEVKPNVFNSQICQTLYDKMGNIVRINDTDLKFKNVRGYVSQITLNLDNPHEDVLGIKNYKTKFEDLFSTITAQTEEMKKNNYLFDAVSSAFTSTGELSEQILQSSIRKVDLDYAFNNGKLTIDEHNGIWGTSDTGVVAFRGGGIFTATEKSTQGNWKWNTGITPEGINADLITSGQLDTNLIRIYSGDNLRFQMNGDGIFAYKSIITDINNEGEHPLGNDITAGNSIDGKQYVLFNDDGLALIAKKGAQVLNSAKTQYITVLDDQNEEVQKNPELMGLSEIKRVEVSWDGFILRNWKNKRVFYADPDTGNLTLEGTINATGGSIGTWNFNMHRLWSETSVSEDGIGGSTYNTYVALNSGGSKYQHINTSTGEKIVNTTPYAFWAGNADPTSAGFYIRKDGKIKATSGSIGGWEIASNSLSSDIISLASTFSNINVDDRQWQIDDQGQTSDNSYVSGTQHAALWVHNSPDKKGASYSKLYISSNGYLYAKQLYFLYHQSNGIISTSQSVKTLIANAQRRANSAYNLASSANRKAEAAQQAAQNIGGYVTSVSLSNDGKLTYTVRNSNGTYSSYNGGQHTS